MRMNPAWAIDEKASILFTSDWTSPTKVPTTMVAAATARNTGSRSHDNRPATTW